jgi:hypothetical protein
VKARGRENEPAASPVVRIDDHFHQAASLERLEIGGERRAVEREQVRHRTHGRRLGAVERGQQRKLPLRQPDRAQCVIETSRQRPRRPLHMQAQATVAHMMRESIRRFGAI